MAKAKKVLEMILDAVSAETEIAVNDIMSKSRDAETVDARHICVKILREYGYYVGRIAELMQMTPRNVSVVLTDFEDRIAMNRLMRRNYEIIANKVKNKLEISTLSQT